MTKYRLRKLSSYKARPTLTTRQQQSPFSNDLIATAQQRGIANVIRRGACFSGFQQPAFQVQQTVCFNYSWRQFRGDVCCLCVRGPPGCAFYASCIYVFSVEHLSHNISYQTPGHRMKGMSYDPQHGCTISAAVKHATGPRASSLFQAAVLSTQLSEAINSKRVEAETTC